MDLENQPEVKSKKLEILVALIITLFACVSAVNGLYGGKYGDDEMIAHNKENQMSVWYQAKSTKQILAENQQKMLEGLVSSQVVPQDHRHAIDSLVLGLQEEIKRYKKEKKETFRFTDVTTTVLSFSNNEHTTAIMPGINAIKKSVL